MIELMWSRAWSSPHDLRRVLPTTRDDLEAFSAHTLALTGEQEAALWLQAGQCAGCTEEVLKCLLELRPEDFFIWTEKINPNSFIELVRDFQLEKSTESEVSMRSCPFQQKSSDVSPGRSEVKWREISDPDLNCSLYWKYLNQFK